MLFKKPLLVLSLAGALVSFAGASFGGPIHALGDQAPVGFNTNNYFYNNARGWRFTANASNINVTQLGVAPVTSGSYTLTLWNYSAQSVLAQTTIANVVGGGWNFANLATSVALTAGQDYLVMGIGNGPSATYYYQNGLPSSWYPNGDISYVNMDYCNSCTANTFPTSVLNGYQYGLVDIGYTLGQGNNVPEPGSLALLGLGLLAFQGARRLSRKA